MKTLFFTVLSVILISCKTTYVYQPLDAADVIYQNGKPIAISPLTDSYCQIVAQKNGNEAWLNIGISNETNRRVNFFPDSIRVFGINMNPGQSEDDPLYGIKYGDPEYEHYVYNFSEYIKKIETQQGIAMGLMAFGAGKQASQAGYSYSTTNSYYSGNAYSSDGTYIQGNASGYSNTTTYDQSKVDEANYRNRQELNDLATRMDKSNEATESGLLKTTTLFPNDYIQGNVVVKLTSGFTEFLRVEIPIGSTTHVFYLSN